MDEVRAYREYWRPRRTRVVLLAESHKQTTYEQFSHTLDLDALRRIPLRRGGYPRHYVKFVYCLAYGQNELLDEPLQANRGTPSYRKILYHCLHRMPTSVPPSGKLNHDAVLGRTPLWERLANKVSLLEELRRAGVWLVDASTTGIARLEPRVKRQVIRDSWEGSVSDLIHSLGHLEEIVVVGIGVSDALKSPLARLSGEGVGVTTILQPEAVRTAGGYNQYYRTLFRVCSRHLWQ